MLKIKPCLGLVALIYFLCNSSIFVFTCSGEGFDAEDGGTLHAFHRGPFVLHQRLALRPPQAQGRPLPHAQLPDQHDCPRSVAQLHHRQPRAKRPQRSCPSQS